MEFHAGHVNMNNRGENKTTLLWLDLKKEKEGQKSQKLNKMVVAFNRVAHAQPQHIFLDMKPN